MALAASFAATSCQSDEEFAPQSTTNKPMVINAVAEGIGAGTRAIMAYKYDLLWSENDEIYVKSSTNNATFTLTTGQGTTNGTFACTSSPFESGDEVEAYYPASLVDNGNLVWPAEQTTSTVVPMYSKKTLGSTGTENFSFASLGAVLQIVFTTSVEGKTLKSITLNDDNATMSGTFTVDENGKAGITATDKADITLDLGEGVPVGLAAKYFNIAVPAGTYSNLSITFTATDNTVCTLKGNVTINHNTVGRLTLTGSKFKSAKLPITGTATATINGKTVDVNWVQLWEGGPRFAEYNVGVTDGKAESYGGYYCWRGSIDSDMWEGYGYCDTANDLWGSNWRMPTKEELDNIHGNCDVEWKDGSTKKYNNTNVKGFLCTGKGDYSENSVFLPAAGYYYFSDVYDDVYAEQGAHGCYWASTCDELTFRSDNWHVSSSIRPALGYSVRAVLNEN